MSYCGSVIHIGMELAGDPEDNHPYFSGMVVCVWKIHRYLWKIP